jgi:FkbM family methyltransferase
VIGRVRAAFGAGASSPEERVAQLKAQLAEARADVEAWKGKAAHKTASLDDLAARLKVMEAEVEDLRARASIFRREAPSPAIVRQSFAQRWRTFRARASASEPTEREARLIGASAAYRQALEHGASALGAETHQMSLEGLTWWVPVQDSVLGSGDEWLEKQRFPYHGILQTRELAVGGIMLDLGANIGRMAIPRVILGDVSAVYCAEPDPVSFRCLASNVIDNGLRGFVVLRRAGASGGFHVVPGATVSDSMIEVPSTTLDAWVERLGIDLDAVTFIKVDVEGYERRLVRGASRVLACRHIVWQMEIKPAGLRSAGDEPSELYADLAHAFTHFIDLNRRAAGARVRPIAELADALAYIEPRDKTDILLFVTA